MTSIHRELEPIVADIMEQGSYPYIEKYIGKPSVPIFFVQMVYSIMRSYSLPAERIHHYCVATAFLQMGIDTHEQVSTGEETTFFGKRSRQLMVLAGDYFSALFYRIMAEQGETKAIIRLSKAVCDINEAKIDLYSLRNKKNTLRSPTALLRRVQGNLVTAVADLFHPVEEGENPWVPFAENVMVLDYLLEDKVRGQFDGLAESLAVEVLQTIPRIEPVEIHQDLIRQIHSRLAPLRQERIVRGG